MTQDLTVSGGEQGHLRNRRGKIAAPKHSPQLFLHVAVWILANDRNRPDGAA